MQSKLDDIGRQLKERREELGYTLDQAEEATRIRKSFLACLEENRFADLPGQAYVTGFVRLYARYLGLDSAPLLSTLRDQRRLEDSSQENVKLVCPQAEILNKTPASTGRYRSLLRLAIILAVGLACYLFFSSRAEEARHESVPPPPVIEQPAKTLLEPSEQQPRAEPTNLQPVPSAPERILSPQTVTPEPEKVVRRPFPTIPSNGASLRMLAVADGALVIKVDTREPHEYKLHDGLDLTWNIKQKVEVKFAASDVAHFWLNGEELDITGLDAFQLQSAE